MKRLLPLLLLASLLSAPAHAQEEALDLSFSGQLRVRGFYLANDTRIQDLSLLDPTTRNSLFPNLNIDDEIDSTQTYLDTRLRLQFRLTAYQQVSAVLGIEVGDITFGVDSTGGGLGTDGRVFENKNLYLEWHPTEYSFKVRAGLYPRESDPLGLVLSNDVAGVHGEIELLGLETTLYADAIMAVENSRLDLDQDGEIDNDYNDRTVFLGGIRSTAAKVVDIEGLFIADIDNTQDTPVGNTESDVFWGGASVRGKAWVLDAQAVFLYAYGRRQTTGMPGVTVRGYAFDGRVGVRLPFVYLQGIFAWASGRDPDRLTTDTAFPTITPFYAASGIIYNNFGGLSVTGSDLAGTAHTTLVVRGSPLDGLNAEAVFQWAWYTSDRDVSNNQLKFNEDARDLGFEVDLNVDYTLVEGFKVYARGSLFFPGKGFLVTRDTRRDGTLAQLILGAQLSF